MRVEECSQAILQHLLPKIDRNREGLCIDVGVGTFAFYCAMFAQSGYESIAVEPLPTQELVRLCRVLHIELMKVCVSDRNGTDFIYIGRYNDSENLNLSSLRSDWWGASSREVQVRTTTLDSLLADMNARRITCLKLDVEGVEAVIIQQLRQTPVSLLPAVVVFEYGGGCTRQDGKAAWNEAGIEGALSCFRILKDLKYRTTILVDSSPESNERVIDLAEVNILPDDLFHPRSIYGNAICVSDRVADAAWIEDVCSRYRDNDAEPPKPLPTMGRLALFTWRLRRGMRGRWR